jgi:branched-chain amino acid transport system ATP-binding protein
MLNVQTADAAALDDVGAPLLSLTGVVQRFGGVRAVDGVDLTVHADTVHGLIGPNGAGKTTLFDAVAGLRPPSGGRIEFEGRDITRLSSVKRARLGIRRTFQRQQPIGWLSVADNVLAALDWHGGGGGTVGDVLALPGRRKLDRQRLEKVRAALDLCGLSDLAEAPAGQLPIAQARLVELARAIVDNPKLLLLDEPTSGLGEGETEMTADVIGRVRSQGCAVLLVEHDMPFIMAVCDVVTVLELGTVIAHGTPEQIQGDATVRLAYLG